MEKRNKCRPHTTGTTSSPPWSSTQNPTHSPTDTGAPTFPTSTATSISYETVIPTFATTDTGAPTIPTVTTTSTESSQVGQGNGPETTITLTTTFANSSPPVETKNNNGNASNGSVASLVTSSAQSTVDPENTTTGSDASGTNVVVLPTSVPGEQSSIGPSTSAVSVGPTVSNGSVNTSSNGAVGPTISNVPTTNANDSSSFPILWVILPVVILTLLACLAGLFCMRRRKQKQTYRTNSLSRSGLLAKEEVEEMHTPLFGGNAAQTAGLKNFGVPVTVSTPIAGEAATLPRLEEGLNSTSREILPETLERSLGTLETQTATSAFVEEPVAFSAETIPRLTPGFVNEPVEYSAEPIPRLTQTANALFVEEPVAFSAETIPRLSPVMKTAPNPNPEGASIESIIGKYGQSSSFGLPLDEATLAAYRNLSQVETDKTPASIALVGELVPDSEGIHRDPKEIEFDDLEEMLAAQRQVVNVQDSIHRHSVRVSLSGSASDSDEGETFHSSVSHKQSGSLSSKNLASITEDVDNEDDFISRKNSGKSLHSIQEEPPIFEPLPPVYVAPTKFVSEPLNLTETKDKSIDLNVKEVKDKDVRAPESKTLSPEPSMNLESIVSQATTVSTGENLTTESIEKPSEKERVSSLQEKRTSQLNEASDSFTPEIYKVQKTPVVEKPTPGKFTLYERRLKHYEEDIMDDLDEEAPPAPTSHVVVASYYPRQPDEMELLSGDLIGIEKEYSDGWARGQNISRGRKRCYFPLAVVTPIKSGPSQTVRKNATLRINAQIQDPKRFSKFIIPDRNESMRSLNRKKRHSNGTLRSVRSNSSAEDA